MGSILVMVICAVSLSGVVAAVVALLRHRGRGALAALAGVVGGVLVLAWVSLVIGVLENVYSTTSAAAWGLLIVGAIGGGLLWVAWRGALGRRILPGHCEGCGYPCAGLTACPECGRKV